MVIAPSIGMRPSIENEDPVTVTPAERAAMVQALELATRGPRGVNPQVGAVLLSPTGHVLSVGWHQGAGSPHAEVDALSKISAEAARGATAIVTLEPCNHTGKTGPCAEALIEAGIARVVYATQDPGVESAGGAERLRAAGIDAEGGLLEREATELIGSWITRTRLGRPQVQLKWAQTLDGRAAAADGTSQWITGEEARADVHRRRAAADAILAGTGTILTDDAALTARDGDVLLENQPVPVVMGRREIPASAKVRSHPHELIQIASHDPRDVLADLFDRGVHTVLIEGGPTIATAFLRAGLVDELLVYVAPALLGGPRLAMDDLGISTMSEIMRFHRDEVISLGEDVLIRLSKRGGDHVAID